MTGNVTQEEIIKFVYGELSFQETADLYDRIDNEPERIADLEVYSSLKFKLDKVTMSPSENVLKRSLEFSRSFELPEE